MSKLDFRRWIIEIPEHTGEKRIKMVDDVPIGDIQPFAVCVCLITDRDVDIIVFDVDFEREHRASRWLPVVFGVERTATVVTEEIAGVFVDIDVFVPVFFLASDEITSTNLLDGLVDILTLCKFKEVFTIQKHAVVTTPRAFGNALEREVRIELDNGLTAGIHFDALVVGHGNTSRRVA